jgi:hypothetical protein
VPGLLSGVSAVSAGDVFAAGNGPSVVLHWNSKRWSSMALPPKTGYYDLNSVSADSGADAWAVGDGVAPKLATKPVALHWNGTSWTRVPTPAPGPRPMDDELYGVSADSTQDAWAVGIYGASGGTTVNALVLHWNGTSWTQVPSHAPANGQLFGVDALSPTDVWAVGQYLVSGLGWKTLVLHWNGTAWSQVASPSVGANPNDALQAVTAISATDIWAAGSYSTHTTPTAFKTLALHWNGTTWTRVPTPAPAGATKTTYSFLYGISADSSADAWAVGSDGIPRGRHASLKPQILHWNGSAWSQAAIPATRGQTSLKGVAALSPTDAWAVGYNALSQVTLIMHWNGTSWASS